MFAQDVDGNIGIEEDHSIMPTRFGILAKLAGEFQESPISVRLCHRPAKSGTRVSQ